LITLTMSVPSATRRVLSPLELRRFRLTRIVK
jgi:hypothetical protein